MEIRLCCNLSPNNKVGKNIVTLVTAEGQLKDATSTIDPVILYKGEYPLRCNYLYLYAFQRWYFVNNIVSVRNGLWELHCHVDVLESFKDSIKAQTAVVARQENNWNLYLNDGFFRTYQDPGITHAVFPNHFENSNHRFILITAGNVTSS